MGKIKFEITLKSIKQEEVETKDKHETKATMMFETGIDEKITIVGDPGITSGYKVGGKYQLTLDNPQQTIEEATTKETKKTEVKPDIKIDTLAKATEVANKVVEEAKNNMPRISDKKRELAAAKNDEKHEEEKKKSKAGMNYRVT